MQLLRKMKIPFDKVKPLAFQGAFLASLYLGMKTISSRMKTPTHPLVCGYVDVIQNEGISQCMTELCGVLEQQTMNRILEMTAFVVRMETSKEIQAQNMILKASTDVLDAVKEGVNEVEKKSMMSSEGVREIAYCKEETIPNLETHLMNLLHNHLLSRR